MPNPVPNTTNHNLPKVPPLDAEYDGEWGYVLNNGEFSDGTDAGSDALVQALEERTPIVDTDANTSNYTPHNNAFYLASDTGQVYIGDGTSWVAQGTVPVDSDVVDAINAEIDNAASSISSLDDVVSSLQSNKLDSSSYTPETDTHDRYTDTEARSAVTGTTNVEDLVTTGTAGTVPVAQSDGTIVMGEVSGSSGEIDLIDVETATDLPDPSTLSKPTIAYINSEDDYVGIFQS